MKQSNICLSVRQTAILLTISVGLCYRLVHEGTIPSVRVGRRILVPVKALYAMLDGNGERRALCLEENAKQQMAMGQSFDVKMEDGAAPSG